MNNLIGITGPFGSGKSLLAVEKAISLADRFKKQLIFNFPVNKAALRQYASQMGYHWVARNAMIRQIEVEDDLMQLWQYHNSVVVFDEAGIFTNARAWKTLGKDFLKPLFQIRHINIHMLVVFQFHDQVDRQIREVFQTWVRCRSISVYDPVLQLPRMHFRMAYYYTPEKFIKLENDISAKAAMVRPWLWATKVEYRYLPIFSFYHSLKSAGAALGSIALNRPLPRHLSLSREQHLFRVFSSKKIVGLGQRRPIPIIEPYPS